MDESTSETKFTFVWHIENYFLCGVEHGKDIESSEFVDSIFRNRWSLQVYPRGNNTEESKEYCSVFLKRCSNYEVDITIGYKVEILDKNNRIIKSNETAKDTFNKTSYSWGWRQFIQINELAEELASSNLLTFRCHIITDKPCEEMYATECISRTQIGIDNFSFLWNIKCSNDVGKWSEPKTFSFTNSSSVKSSWKFTADVLHLRINKVNDDNRSRFILCDLTLLDKNKKKFSSKQESFFFTSENNSWEFYSFITKSLLKVKESLLLHSTGYNIKCEFTISNGSDSNSIEYIYSNSCAVSSSDGDDDINSVPTLLSDLKELFINKRHTDIQLHVAGEVILVHKCILTARSPVFCAMFDNDMTENQSGIVKIDDVDANTLSDLMEFLYTGKVNLRDETALKLIVAANKYQVSTLTAKCSLFLKSILSQDNVCEILGAADLVGCADLKNDAIDYIKTHASSILVTEKWFDWARANFQLGSEVICKLSVEVADATSKM